MSLFLSPSERAGIQEHRRSEPLSGFYWALLNRAERRAASPGLSDATTTTDWWHHALEVLTDAAMAHALRPTEALGAWLRATTLEIARRPLKDWVGPGFRYFNPENPVGHLETGHLSVALAVVLDLAADVFTEAERAELAETLVQKGIRLCRAWMDSTGHLNNWRCILLAGVAVPAAVLNRKDDMDFAAAEFKRCVDCFQPDGSYGESLQYGNYAMTGLVWTREALMRRQPSLDNELPLEPYVHMPRWNAASHLYCKPLSGWGALPVPRSVNFNDSAAIYRPSADNLLHIAARGKDRHPESAARALQLFDELYVPCTDQGPTDLASFGFVNDFGFLTLPLYGAASEARATEKTEPEPVEVFSCGDVIARDGTTVLAAKTGGGPLHSVAHLHGDLNSFMLVHNRERLLVDPGHACYRNLIHGIEISTYTHNTCVFETEAGDGLNLQEDQHRRIRMEQTNRIRRLLDEGFTNGPTCDRGAKLLLAQRAGHVTAIGSEASALYGAPLREFTRFWLMCGPHAVFVIDRVHADRPVKTSWSWLLNNRDGLLALKMVPPDRMVARRGNAGMKLFHLGDGGISGPQHAHVHDAYHPLPNQASEGKPGSGMLVRTADRSARTQSLTVHAICLDTPGLIADWHLKREDDFAAILESPDKRQWKLSLNETGSDISVLETATGRITRVTETSSGQWEMETSQ
ncbi:MAG: heparinase II/III family protein [Verrucomicrobia bacterium]|nr:heparinase II/III family protein [Verrucomicrobiota bacterium]MCH8525857.1 heparinase II/III family protein [Kiritimatiellia bacterium]